MGALTQEIPKPMLWVDGRPILEHILIGLGSAGFRQCCLVTGWKGDVIRAHFGEGARLGLEMTYVHQEVADGTGRAPALARDFVGSDPFLLSYGDILVRPQTYRGLRELWCDRSPQTTGIVTVTRGEDVTQGGLLLFDRDFVLRKLVEKPSPDELAALRAEGWLRPEDPVWYNAGIYMFDPVLFEYTDRLQKSVRGEYELTDAITDMINRGNQVLGLEIEGRWVDVRDPQVLARIQSGVGGENSEKFLT